MSKIELDSLSRGLKDYLNNLNLTEMQILELVSNLEKEKIGFKENLNTTDKTIVGAINEVKDSINDIDFDNIELPLYQKKEDNELLTESKEIVEAINEVRQSIIEQDLSLYQSKTDNDLLTTNKTIVEAINEIYKSQDVVKQELVAALVSKGLSSNTNESLSNLINKISKINNIKNITGTAVASNVLSGKTFINSTGNTITGSMVNQGSKTITPGYNDQVLSAGYYSGITIAGDANLKASNIRGDYEIFGVAGTYYTSQSITLTNPKWVEDDDGWILTVEHDLGTTPSNYGFTLSGITWVVDSDGDESVWTASGYTESNSSGHGYVSMTKVSGYYDYEDEPKLSCFVKSVSSSSITVRVVAYWGLFGELTTDTVEVSVSR